MSKYNGFYDYALDEQGSPDRTFAAKDFCMHLKGLIGNGIGVTNATGNDAWQVKKIDNENLKVKITLGNNGYNFASVNGNPFAVDEEITLELSQGVERWDAIIIRANSTSSVRKTDIVVVENSMAITRTADIYDLRLARIHIENSVITEIKDDRLNNEYCGIAAGLATINADTILQQIQDELVAIENGSLTALKNGTLQSNLNAEKINSKTLDEVLTLVLKPTDIIHGVFTCGAGAGNNTIDIGIKPGLVLLNNTSGNIVGILNDEINTSGNDYITNTGFNYKNDYNERGSTYAYVAFKY